MSGSIIANQGFIDQFGETQPDGSKVLNTSWGALRRFRNIEIGATADLQCLHGERSL
jgi:hypothetical protein